MTATNPNPPVKPEMKTPWWQVTGKIETARMILAGELSPHMEVRPLTVEERATFARRWLLEALMALDQGPASTPAETWEAEWINKGCPE